MTKRTSIAYLIEPNFPGGTSSAFASELKVAVGLGRVKVYAYPSAMFKTRKIAGQIRDAMRDLNLELIWDAPNISADVVIVQNPSFLKFEEKLSTRIVAGHLIAVAHENFYRPGRIESFDVAKCLDLLDRASIALKKSIAPISPYNRAGITDWLHNNPSKENWNVLADNWFNICDFTTLPAATAPADRRGRLSRPGMEKFPNLADMDLCFPRHAQSNVILGADLFLRENLPRPHWNMHAFQGLEVGQFFEMIDFLVYFTAPTLRESFGRVLAEAIAAGKVVISDAQTASVFKGAVIGATPAQVDAIIAHYVANPGEYKDQVALGQAILGAFSADAFRGQLETVLNQDIGNSK